MKISFKKMLIGVVVLGLIVGVGFAALRGNSSASAAGANASRQSSAAGAAGGASQFGGQQSGSQQSGARPTTGVVDSVGDQQFAVKEANGSNTTTVRVNDKTTYRKQAQGALTDIKKGDRVVVRAEAGGDGTENATSIQLLPADANNSGMAGGFQGGQQGGQGAQNGGQQRQGGQQGGQGGQNGGQNGTMVFGTVNSIDGNTISITAQAARTTQSGSQNGPTKVTVTDKTTITKEVDGSFQDVQQGTSVAVTGPKGADGVVVASNVQIMPAGAGQMRRGQQGQQ